MIESTENQTISQTEPTAESPIQHEVKGYHFLGNRMERIVFLVLLTLISCGPMIFGKSIPSHADWHIHMEHVYNFKRCFWQGQWLPRWIDAHTSGYGLPIFNYYAPLVYYFFVLIDLIFRNPLLSIKWIYITPMLLSTVFGYLYLRRHGSPVASILACAFVIFSPAIHIYIYNTNWPNSTIAIPFLFLTLYGIDSFDKNKEFDLKSFLITSTGFACLALSHLATAFVLVLLSVPYFFLSLLLYRTKKFVKWFFLSYGFGVALSSFYLLPACLEKRFVHTDEILTQGPLWDFSKNFLYTYLDRHRDDGYAWAIFDHRYYEVSNALFSLVVLTCLVTLLLNWGKVKLYFIEPLRIKMASLMFVISFLMMTPVSLYVWLMIKPLQTIQFPWRFTTFVLTFGVVILVYAFDLIGKILKEKFDIYGYKIIIYATGFTFCLLLYVDFINMYHWGWVPEENLLKSAISISWASDEYRPNITGDPDWRQTDLRHDFSPAIQSTNPYIDITIKKWLSHERMFEIFSPTPHQVRLRTFFFPGWNVYIDGKNTIINIDPKSGAMVFEAPGGKHEITVRFENTPIRKISLYISFGALIVFLLLLTKYLGQINLKNIIEKEITKTRTQAEHIA
ncbi:MAG: hypothetical protein HYY52_02815 [Candidatus Melainabacteria bacterium]|nr:hypothetical protein [Candidatus Melainabacteria bacterium]